MKYVALYALFIFWFVYNIRLLQRVPGNTDTELAGLLIAFFRFNVIVSILGIFITFIRSRKNKKPSKMTSPPKGDTSRVRSSDESYDPKDDDWEQKAWENAPSAELKNYWRERGMWDDD